MALTTKQSQAKAEEAEDRRASDELDQRIEVLLERLKPTESSEQRRQSVADYVRFLIARAFHSPLVEVGQEAHA